MSKVVYFTAIMHCALADKINEWLLDIRVTELLRCQSSGIQAKIVTLG
jgi:hypothetical protein